MLGKLWSKNKSKAENLNLNLIPQFIQLRILSKSAQKTILLAHCDESTSIPMDSWWKIFKKRGKSSLICIVKRPPELDSYRYNGKLLKFIATKLLNFYCFELFFEESKTSNLISKCERDVWTKNKHRIGIRRVWISRISLLS